jgi:hypothetical protein
MERQLAGSATKMLNRLRLSIFVDAVGANLLNASL